MGMMNLVVDDGFGPPASYYLPESCVAQMMSRALLEGAMASDEIETGVQLSENQREELERLADRAASRFPRSLLTTH